MTIFIRLELERVLPQLKVVVKTDPRDWRAHWEQMKMLRGNIGSVSNIWFCKSSKNCFINIFLIAQASEETIGQLEKLRNDISFAMEKIESREKHLNNDLTGLIEQYKNVTVEWSEVRAAIKETDADKASLEQRLDKTVHEFENVKIQMEQRGNTMTDGSEYIAQIYVYSFGKWNVLIRTGPLINIKKAISKIKEEIIEMELEVGVMKHSVDQDILKQNAIYAELEPPPSVF